jgi:hypothetical protein
MAVDMKVVKAKARSYFFLAKNAGCRKPPVPACRLAGF